MPFCMHYVTSKYIGLAMQKQILFFTGQLWVTVVGYSCYWLQLWAIGASGVQISWIILIVCSFVSSSGTWSKTLSARQWSWNSRWQQSQGVDWVFCLVDQDPRCHMGNIITEHSWNELYEWCSLYVLSGDAHVLVITMASCIFTAKPLSKAKWTYYDRCSVAFNWEHMHKMCSWTLFWYVLVYYTLKLIHLPD